MNPTPTQEHTPQGLTQGLVSQVLAYTFNENEENIIDNIINKRSNIFLHGPGGTGKSVLISETISRINKLKSERIIAITGSTGISAVLIKGTTLHRFSGIGLGKDEKLKILKRVNSKPKAKENIKTTSTLFIDEISMIGAELFDKIDFVFRKVRKNENPFGGMQIVLIGDLLQLPPINDAYIFESEVWQKLNLKIFNLSEPKRFTDRNYFDLLSRVREGTQTEEDYKVLDERHKEYKRIKSEIKNWEIRPTILYAKKVDVEAYNKRELEKIKGDQYDFECEDEITPKKANVLITQEMEEFYSNLIDSAIPKTVSLKVGCQVMLRKNIDIEAGLVNGSLGVVLFVNELNLSVKVKFFNGIVADIARETWEIKENDIIYSRTQVPFILSYAMTIHKSQGCTLDLMIGDLSDDVFAEGQGYVLLSRVKDIKGLFLMNFKRNSIKTNKKIVEYVRNL